MAIRVVLVRVKEQILGLLKVLHPLLALDQDRPIAAAALHLSGEYASMAFAGTLPEHRGKGAPTTLLAHSMRLAREAGCRYVISETAEQKADQSVVSYRNMIRMGFEEVYLRKNYLFEC